MTAETRAENLLRNRLHLHTFKKSRHFHTNHLEHIDSVHLSDGISFEVCEYVCSRACVCGCWRPEFSVAYGNVLPPTILHLLLWYHSPSSLWSASRWHSCLASFITALWWMRRPHLHNSARAGVVEWKETHKSSRTLDTHLKHVRHVWFLFEEKATHLLKCAWIRISCSKLV